MKRPAGEQGVNLNTATARVSAPKPQAKKPPTPTPATKPTTAPRPLKAPSPQRAPTAPLAPKTASPPTKIVGGNNNCNIDVSTAPTSAANIKDKSRVPKGGDFKDCLSAIEIDGCVRPLLGDSYVDAIVLYNVRTECVSAESVENMLRRRLARHPIVVAPLHVRHHWTMCVFELSAEGALTANVIDSAPGRATADDIAKLLRRLHVQRHSITCCGRQPYNTNECGVHAVLNAWRAFFNEPLVMNNNNVSLEHLRPELERLARNFSIKLAEDIARKPVPRPPTYEEGVKWLGEARQQQQHQQQQQQKQQQQQQQQQPQETAQPKTRQNNPYAASGTGVTVTANVPDGGNAKRGEHFDPEAAAAQHNQCYIFSVLQLLGEVAPSHFRQIDDTNELAALQTALNQKVGVQHDTIETAHLLIEQTSASIELHYTAGTINVACSPAVLIAAVPGVAIREPDGYKLQAVVGFTGYFLNRGHGLADSRSGHYICRKTVAELGGARPVLFAYRKSAPVPARILRAGPRVYMSDVRREAWERDRAAAAGAAKEAAARAAQLASTAASNVPQQQQQQHAPTAAEPTATTATKVAVVVEAQTASTEPAQAQATKADTPIVLTALERRNIIKEFGVGDVVKARWAVVGKETGNWVGKVVRKASYGLTCRVDWAAEACQTCLRWAPLETFQLDLPHPGVVYYNLQKIGAMPTNSCSCKPQEERVNDEEAVLQVDVQHDTLAPQTLEARRTLASRRDKIAEPEVVRQAMRSGAKVAASKTGNKQQQQQEHDGASTARVNPVEAEMQPNPNIGYRTKPRLDGSVGRCWHIYQGRPKRVHMLTWARLAPSTRRLHIRLLDMIHGMPRDLTHVDLPIAIIELVMRMASSRNWAWSTVSSTLSSFASALNALPIYTDEAEAIDIRRDPVYADAMRRAQHQARVSTRTQISDDMPIVTYQRLCGYEPATDGVAKISDAVTRLFLQVSWACAGRVGDVRQLRPGDIEFARITTSGHEVHMTFRAGKGAAFWGPYTIHTVLAADVAKDLRAHIANVSEAKTLFTLNNQKQLAAATKAVGLTVRSIRRGALTHAARNGVGDNELRLLSGHKREDTLMRYLGWGALSASRVQAANERARLAGTGVPVGAGDADDAEEYTGAATEAPNMGLFSGRNGDKGRRIEQPPPLFPLKTPSHAQLGIPAPADAGDPLTWPLHIKKVTLANWDALQQMADGTRLAADIKRAREWCETDKHYGGPAQINAANIPYTRMTAKQIEELIEGGKLVPYSGRMDGFVKGWLLPQAAKRNQRPIFEPSTNNRLAFEKMLTQRYPTRLERRAAAIGATYEAQFDFSAYFDQFALAPTTHSYHVLRTRDTVRGSNFFALTRLPMGARQAPGIAQVVTWLMVWPLLSMPGIRVDTMIDNVRILGDDPTTFTRAVKTFLQRASLANLTLNDAEKWRTVTQKLLQQTCAIKLAPRVFLGEEYMPDGTIRNTTNNVDKLRKAVELFNEKLRGNGVLTHRQFAALVGLTLFMAHTVNIHVYTLFDLLRTYSAIVGGVTEWDSEIMITSNAALEQLHHLIAELLENTPVPLPVIIPPSRNIIDYTAVAIVDASAAAWGAYVHFPATGETTLLQERWEMSVAHSAHAEPRAALNVVRWIVKAGRGQRMAIITDHQPLVTAQRRWSSNFCGFGRSFFINSFFAELYTASPAAVVFHVDGTDNIADEPSRDPNAPFTLQAKPAKIHFPSLHSLTLNHEQINREKWQV